MLEFHYHELERKVFEESRRFAREVLRPYAAEADRTSDIPAALLEKPEVINFMKAYIPLELGGGWSPNGDGGEVYDLADSARLRLILNEAGGYGDASLFIAMPGPALAEPILRAYGSPAQQRHYFDPFLQGVPKWAAFAMSEPNAGSDVAAITTTARREANSYVLNGTKWFIGNGSRADWLVVFATINSDQGQFGLRSFIVERGTPGFRVNRILPTMGLKAVRVSELVFEECRIPRENLLHPEKTSLRKGGLQGGLKTFHVFRPAVAATGLGVAQAALEWLEETAAQDGARHSLARRWREAAERVEGLKRRLHAARLLCWKAAWVYDEGRDNSMEASMAKALAAHVAMRVCTEAMDIAGLAGLDAESPLERLFRDAKAFDLLEGTGDIQRLTVSKALLRR
jgi:acyl-CoA dehydrogenase